MQQLHPFTTDAIKRHHATPEIHVHAQPRGFGSAQGGFHASVPGRKATPTPMNAPGDAAAYETPFVLVTLAWDPQVRHADVDPRAAHVHLKVTAPWGEALNSQRLLPVLEALRMLGVAVLPGRGVGQLPASLSHAQELVHRVAIER